MTVPSMLQGRKSIPPRPTDVVADRAVNPAVLMDVLRKSLQTGSRGGVVFDLDSTLFMNFTRWVHILKEFAQVYHVPELLQCKEEHISGFSVYWSMVQAGVSHEKALELEQEATAFWAQRFYTSPYCLDDVPVDGAQEYLLRLYKQNTQIVYCTGRHTDMYQGTVDCLQKYNMPTPDGKQVHLLVKPTFSMSDDEWKELAYQKLREFGEVIAVFDNEPAHINGYHHAFPSATAIHLLTNDSGRGVLVHPDICSVRHFVLPLDP